MANLINMLQWDATIFDDLDLPSEFDADLLKYLILEKLGDRTPIYGNPTLFKFNIQNWFSYKKPVFEKLWETMNYDYNPIENYDRKEESVRDTAGHGSQLSTNQTERQNDTRLSDATGRDLKHKGTDIHNLSGVDTVTDSGNDTVSYTGTDVNEQSGTDSLNRQGSEKDSHTGSDTTSHNVSAFNESSYQNDTQDILEHGEAVTHSYIDRIDKTNYGKKDELKYGKKETTEYGKSENTEYGKTDTETLNLNDVEKTTHETDTSNIEKLAGANTVEHETENSEYVKLRAHGNIGVTTTQAMIEEQRRVVQFHVYDVVIDMFENKFFVCCW